jgi:hypothetical protein
MLRVTKTFTLRVLGYKNIFYFLGYKNKKREWVTKTYREKLGYKNTQRVWVTKTIGLQKKITQLQKLGYKKSFTHPPYPVAQ